jgi:hypothetical protein
MYSQFDVFENTSREKAELSATLASNDYKKLHTKNEEAV